MDSTWKYQGSKKTTHVIYSYNNDTMQKGQTLFYIHFSFLFFHIDIVLLPKKTLLYIPIIIYFFYRYIFDVPYTNFTILIHLYFTNTTQLLYPITNTFTVIFFSTCSQKAQIINTKHMGLCIVLETLSFFLTLILLNFE